MVTSPVLVTSSHKTENETREGEEEEEDDNEDEEEKENEEEGDSGTESVPEVKETVLWEEKVTFANLPCNNQPMVDGL